VTVKESFDAVIVGTSLASLTAGALLARRGLRVLLVGNGETEHDNGALLLDTITSPLVMRIFEELGVTHMVKRKVRRPEPVFQVILPQARIDVYPQLERFEKEIEREFPRIAEDVKLACALLPEMMEGMEKVLMGEHLLPPRGIIEKKRIDLLLARSAFRDRTGRYDVVARILADPAFACFLGAVAGSHAPLAPGNLQPAGLLFLHRRKVEHCAVFEGGLRALKQILYDKIASYGGDVRSTDRIEAISLQGRNVAAARLAGKDSMIGCDFLLSGIPGESLGALLTVEGRSVKEDLLRGEDLVPTGYVVAADLIVAREAWPEPMASNVIVVFDGARPLRESNYLWAEADDVAVGGRKARRLTLHYILERATLTADPSYSRRVLDDVLGNLGTLVPWLDRFIIDCQDPVAGIMKSHSTEDPMLEIARLMPAVHAWLGAADGPFVGLGHATGIRNVYRANAEVCPSMGEDGLWLAGLGAAKIIASQRKGKTRLRRRIMFS